MACSNLRSSACLIVVAISGGVVAYAPSGLRRAGPSSVARASVRRARPVSVFKFLEDALAPKVGPDATQESSRLVPDVFDAPFEETVELEVRYPAWVRSSVDMKDIRSFGDTPTEGAGLLRQIGAVVKPTQVRDAPKVFWEAAAANAADNDPLAAAPDEELKYYTLALIDPDAPTPAQPSSRSWVHWLVVNIPGSDIESGTTLRRYVGAFPPSGAGPHRYFFLLMEQRDGPQRFDGAVSQANELTAEDMQQRSGWSAAAFAAKHNLRAVGWHHFNAEFDPYCLELLQEFKTLR